MTSITTRRTAVKPSCILAAFAAAASCAGLVPAHAKAKKAAGVWAWTKGSQTYIRARPSIATPPVAKVVKHTKLFVWGKFDGWYRVETSDKKFGWIHNAYLNPSDKEKIAALSHRRARQASNRTEDQTMYGSPQQLRTHYARYGAKGALVGLRKNGVRVSKVRVAQARAASTRVAKPRVAAKRSDKAALRLATNNQTRVYRTQKTSLAAPRLANAPGTRAAIARPSADSNFDTRDEPRLMRTPDGTISSGWRRRDNARNNATTDSGAAENVSNRSAETRQDEERRAAIRREETRLASLRAETARLEKQRLQEQKMAQARRNSQAERAANAERLAQAQQEAAARAANAQATRLLQAQRAAEIEANRRANAQRKAQERRVAAQKREAARRAASQRRRAVRLAKAKARQQRAQLYAARRAAEREELRRRMSMNPPSPQAAEAGLRPLSPEELLRAREQFLSSRRKTRPSAQRPAPRQPAASTRDNLFESNPPAGSAFNRQPMSQEQPPQSGPAFQEMNYSSRGSGGFMLVSQKLLAKKIAARPNDARFSRGGSPRDYARNRSRNIGDGMATQALSYRGMPYIRGASSSRRGFDCSGLVYFLLRQRGYNPPRTAAGLASYGNPISRRNLQSGDIVLFANTYKRGVSHVGVYIGNNNFVHAANGRGGVKTDSLTSGYYARKYYGARRAQ